MADPCRRLVVRPSPQVQLLMVLVLSPGWGAGAITLVLHPSLESVGVCLGMIAIAAAIWAYSVGGLRIIVTDATVEQRRLFTREWRVAFDQMTIQDGLGGDIPIFAAYILRDRHGNLGTIIKTTFGRERLLRLLNCLVDRGAEFVQDGR